MFDGLFGLFSRDIGIDLGTANTLVHVRGRGIVIAEPSVVAKDQRTGAVLLIGAEAKRMVGRTPASIVAIRPLKDGVISDFDITEQMLNYFIRKVHGDRALLYPRPRVIVGIPSGVTEVEKRAVEEASLGASTASPSASARPRKRRSRLVRPTTPATNVPSNCAVAT